MPQLQPGQVTPGQNGAPKLYGTGKNENSIPFHERMFRLFKPQEFVTIKNIDDEPLYWQYMPIENEEISSTEDGMQKIVTRQDPEMWVIMPGESEVVVGASAYRALDVMYKTVSAKRTLNRFNDPSSPQYDENGKHMPKNFNYADGSQQEAFLELAYIGKARPVFGTSETVEMPTIAENAPVSNMVPMTQAVEDDTTPVPRVTGGAPLEEPVYAEPDKSLKPKSKELQNAGKEK